VNRTGCALLTLEKLEDRTVLSSLTGLASELAQSVSAPALLARSQAHVSQLVGKLEHDLGVMDKWLDADIAKGHVPAALGRLDKQTQVVIDMLNRGAWQRETGALANLERDFQRAEPVLDRNPSFQKLANAFGRLEKGLVRAENQLEARIDIILHARHNSEALRVEAAQSKPVPFWPPPGSQEKLSERDFSAMTLPEIDLEANASKERRALDPARAMPINEMCDVQALADWNEPARAGSSGRDTAGQEFGEAYALESLAPREADLLTATLPSQSGTLDLALQQFLSQLDEIGRQLSETVVGQGWLPWIMGAGLIGAAAQEFARRRVGRLRGEPALALPGNSPSRVPGLPTSFSFPAP
jgi:hypothetical protein